MGLADEGISIPRGQKMDTQAVLTPAAAANILNCSAMTIRRMMDSGKLGGTTTPLGRLVSATDVLALARDRVAEGVGDGD